MLIIILSIIILYHHRMPLMLSLCGGHIFEISNTAMTQGTKINTYDNNLNSSLFEVYPVIISSNWVQILQICLKDTLLLDKLHMHLNDCNNYSCMFSKVIVHESMKSVLSIIRNDTMDDTVNQEFKLSIQDCSAWWKLFKHIDRSANLRRELGRCLFQTFSFKCKESVLDKIRLLLMTKDGK